MISSFDKWWYKQKRYNKDDKVACRHFVRFLKRQGIYSEFNDMIKDKFNNVKDICKDYIPYSYISGAFTWMKSPSGYDKWYQYNMEWRNWLKRNRQYTW